MTERPILFSGPMVRALLDGRKTQTRRIVKPMPKWADRFPICKPDGMAAGHQIWWWDGEFDRVGVSQSCPYGRDGDRLYVRETWKPHSTFAGLKPRDIPASKVFYKADNAYAPSNTPWKPGIHQPRWASRLRLAVSEVRVERLQDISDADAEAEGVREPTLGAMVETALGGVLRDRCGAVAAYAALWESINGKGSWAANPWVWVVTFEVRK